MSYFKSNEILILLGAGASVNAGLSDSNKMITNIEDLIYNEKDDWGTYTNLYNYIKSSIFHASGIQGDFGDTVSYNIEKLVSTLEEIHRKNLHPLYPFVGAWNPSLIEVAGKDFMATNELKEKIVEILRKKWIALDRIEKAQYFEALMSFQKEYQQTLRIFSLNYDLCVEKVCGHQSKVERGFDENAHWDWRRFDDDPDEPKELVLYKLHGSTDWEYSGGFLTYKDEPSSIDTAAIIFGDSYKLQYIDPFLFLMYEFRRWTLEARLLISIGYGFGDEHINGILTQSLAQDPNRHLLAVSYPTDETIEEKRIRKLLKLADSTTQLTFRKIQANEFLAKNLKIQELSSLFPTEQPPFPDLGELHRNLISEPLPQSKA